MASETEELKCGEVVVPWRAIGEVGPEYPVLYPKSWPELIERALKRRGGAPLRLYADGIFDLCHYGHLRALEQAKKSFPNTYLLVGCCNDADTHKYKGQTVMSEEERLESLRHCKWVDEVVRDAPWVITKEFLDEHDIDFVCHDDLPYVDVSGASGCGDVYEPIKRMGKFHATQRTEGVSTSDLIIRIVKRYDDFVRRNMARGYSGREMGVPYIKEKSIQFEMALEKSAAAAQATVQSWADVAEEVHYDFLGLFSRDGPIRSTLRTVRGNIGAMLTGGLGLGNLLGANGSGTADAGIAHAAEASSSSSSSFSAAAAAVSHSVSATEDAAAGASSLSSSSALAGQSGAAAADPAASPLLGLSSSATAGPGPHSETGSGSPTRPLSAWEHAFRMVNGGLTGAAAAPAAGSAPRAAPSHSQSQSLSASSSSAAAAGSSVGGWPAGSPPRAVPGGLDSREELQDLPRLSSRRLQAPEAAAAAAEDGADAEGAARGAGPHGSSSSTGKRAVPHSSAPLDREGEASPSPSKRKR